MVRGSNTKGMVVLLSLLVATFTNAVPTTSECNKALAFYNLSAKSNAHSKIEFEISQIFELSNWPPATIVKEFHRPSVSFANSPSSIIGTKSLPVKSHTALMILTGFLCISLVKDHKFWLAAFISLLWAAQTGLAMLPKLASHLSIKNHNKQLSHLSAARVRGAKFPSSSRSIKIADDTSLLRHSVRISKRKQTILLPALPLAFVVKRSNLATLPDRFVKTKYNLTANKFTLTGLSNRLILPSDCSVCPINQFVHFSSASFYAYLARGPPNLA